MKSRGLAVTTFLLMTATQMHAQQFPPSTLHNVKALPKDISVSALVDTMKAFTRALGVRCSYCHVGKEGADLKDYDFASDDKAAKAKARQMLEMVSAINGKYLAGLVDRREPSIAVTCATCHRGVSQPRPLQQIVLSTWETAGVDSAIATYKALRTRYYGRAAYDFGEVTLVDVANAVAARGKPAEALAFHKLNTEMLPGSGFALRSAAEGFLAVGDTTSAIASYNKALVINAKDQQSIDALARLKH